MPGKPPTVIPWTQIPIVATVARALARDLTAQNEYLIQENRILRGQIPGRILLDDEERCCLAQAASEMPRELMEKTVSIFQPETILRWIREFVRKKWTCRGPSEETPPKRGRPCTAKEREALVLRLARENSWGYDRIHGELVQMGVPVSETTIRDILRRNGLPLNPRKKGLPWCEFLRRHADNILCADLTTHEIWTFCGLTTV